MTMADLPRDVAPVRAALSRMLPPTAATELTAQIREALLHEGWAPPGRVFFDGDTVPGDIIVMTRNGDFEPYPTDEVSGNHPEHDEWDNGNLGPLVEITVDYDTVVARARERQGDAVWSHTSGVTP